MIKQSIGIILLCLVFVLGYSQKDTSTIEKYDGWKKGTGTFSLKLSVRNFERYLLKPVKAKDFEKTLGHYDRRWYDSDSHINDDGKSIIVMPYIIRKNDEFYELTLRYDGKSEIINSITIEVVEDDIRINKILGFINELTSTGYVLDLASARMADRYGTPEAKKAIFYNNKIKKIRVSIYEVDYDHLYRVTFYKKN